MELTKDTVLPIFTQKARNLCMDIVWAGMMDRLSEGVVDSWHGYEESLSDYDVEVALAEAATAIMKFAYIAHRAAVKLKRMRHYNVPRELLPLYELLQREDKP